MRIVCDNCGAKYQISDDKVRNKVFKIRCKKCSHVIVVRGGAQAEAEQPEAESTHDSPAAASTDAVGLSPAGGLADAAALGVPSESAALAPAVSAVEGGWFVVVNREQVGPLTVAQVAEHFEAGEVDSETFSWAEGMSDWVRLGTIDEFKHLFEAGPGDVGSGPIASPFDGGGGDEDDVVMASNNAAAEKKSTAANIFGDGGDVPDPRVDAQSLRSQRNENSVLFSLDSLAAELGDETPVVSNTGGSEGSGLIDISTLGQGANLPAAGGSMSPFGSAASDDFAGAPAAPSMGSPMVPMVNRRSGGTGKIIAITAAVVFVLGGAGVGGFLLLRGDDATESEITVAKADQAPAKVNVGAVPAAKPEPPKPVEPAAAAAPAPAVVAANPVAAPTPGAAAVPDPAPKPVSAAAKPKSTRSKARRASARKAAAEVAAPAPAPRPAARSEPTPKPARAPRAKPKRGGTDEVDDLLAGLEGGGTKKSRSRRAAQPKPADEPAPSNLPERLGRSQILTVVRRNARNIQRCKSEDADASGTVSVMVVIARSGVVDSARVTGGKFKGTAVGSCVERTVKTYRFPAFSGDPLTVNLPFSL